ncbi:MAG TPA: hypothetical protein VFN24_14010 [Microbacterium sp.]|nr:hypothetical protein [Microbacterium sp.]
MSPTQADRFVYFPHRGHSHAELSAARIDGRLVELGEGYIPADAVETPALRAASIATILGDRLAATHLTAAWVHGAVDDLPARLHVQRAVPHRIRPVIDHRIHYRDSQVQSQDLALLGGVLVTTVVRTLADLARDEAGGTGDGRTTAAIARLATDARIVRQAIVSLALQDAVPGKPAALSLLRRLEVTATTM